MQVLLNHFQNAEWVSFVYSETKVDRKYYGLFAHVHVVCHFRPAKFNNVSPRFCFYWTPIVLDYCTVKRRTIFWTIENLQMK